MADRSDITTFNDPSHPDASVIALAERFIAADLERERLIKIDARLPDGTLEWSYSGAFEKEHYLPLQAKLEKASPVTLDAVRAKARAVWHYCKLNTGGVQECGTPLQRLLFDLVGDPGVFEEQGRWEETLELDAAMVETSDARN